MPHTLLEVQVSTHGKGATRGSVCSFLKFQEGCANPSSRPPRWLELLDERDTSNNSQAHWILSSCNLEFGIRRQRISEDQLLEWVTCDLGNLGEAMCTETTRKLYRERIKDEANAQKRTKQEPWCTRERRAGCQLSSSRPKGDQVHLSGPGTQKTPCDFVTTPFLWFSVKVF